MASDTSITLGGSDGEVLVILQLVLFTVEESATEQKSITVTLNSATWLTEAALQAGVVEDAAIQGAFTTAVSTEPRN